MIFYFSGTGNSKAVATVLAKELNDEAINIVGPGQADKLTDAKTQSTIGIVFPIYGWNPPSVIYDFIRKMLRSGVHANYLYFIATCGDDIGMADRQMHRFLRKQNVTYSSFFSVIMPNTYIGLPGFDIDSDDVIQRKLTESKNCILAIAQQIKEHNNITSVKRGCLPWVKTYFLGKMFAYFLITDKYFHTTSKCTLCKSCIKVCPQQNINILGKRITWNNKCTGCLACYHHCPHKAIYFGIFSKNKGQYFYNKHLGKHSC